MPKCSRFDGAICEPQPKPIIIVQGGQWGSEAKGAVTAAFIAHRKVNFAVRTGAVNAGHTFYHNQVEYKMQQIPCGFHNKATMLVIGAGAMIHPQILNDELGKIYQFTGEDIRGRLLIDFRAGIHLEEHQERSKAANRHHKMGATGKGCSEAVTAKIRERGNDVPLLFKSWLDGHISQLPWLQNLTFIDTEKLLNDAYDSGLQILLEATQGTLLDLHLGPYPYVTHKQSIAAQWITECGLSPNLRYEIALVCRTYPIRVAGNSGPMPGEISWIELAREINRKLSARGLSPLVAESALDEFERACNEIGWSKYDLPDVRFDCWLPEERKQYSVALSELHRDAINAVGARTSDELRKFFEMTTVTKKLRRIAVCHVPTMRTSMRQNRPNYVVLTFLNYVFPQYWNESKVEVVVADPDVRHYLHEIESSWGCEVHFITTGPKTEHVLDIRQYRAGTSRGPISN